MGLEDLEKLAEIEQAPEKPAEKLKKEEGPEEIGNVTEALERFRKNPQELEGAIEEAKRTAERLRGPERQKAKIDIRTLMRVRRILENEGKLEKEPKRGKQGVEKRPPPERKPEKKESKKAKKERGGERE